MPSSVKWVVMSCVLVACAPVPEEPELQTSGDILGSVLLEGVHSVLEHAGTTVRVVGLGNAAETDNDGRFHIEDVPSGQVALEVFHPGYARTWISDVPVEAGVNVSARQAVLEPMAGEVHGTIPGAREDVLVVVPTAGRVGLSDREGSFTVPDVPAGDHEVVVSVPGFETWAIGIVVGPATAVDLGVLELVETWP